MLKMVGIMVALSLTLAGCTNTYVDKTQVQADQAAHFSDTIDDDHKYSIITDNATGCKYLMAERGLSNYAIGGIAPLLDANGKPTGCRSIK